MRGGEKEQLTRLRATGFNQEDSLIVNREALERGLFRSIKYQLYKDEERVNGADAEKFENPATVDGCVGLRAGCYDKLQQNGIMAVGESVGVGDVIVGKTITTTELGEGVRKSIKRDRSTIVKQSDNAIVDAVMLSRNKDGAHLVKIRTRTTRIPITGDKLRYNAQSSVPCLCPLDTTRPPLSATRPWPVLPTRNAARGVQLKTRTKGRHRHRSRRS